MTFSQLRSQSDDSTFDRRWGDAKGCSLSLRKIEQQGFEDIKRKARVGWERDDVQRAKSATTYRGQHCAKTLDEPTKLRRRPCSPTRLNNPHPPEVFLVTRLHSIPGYVANARLDAASDPRDKDNKYPWPGTVSWTLRKTQTNRDKEVFQSFGDSYLAQAVAAGKKLTSESGSMNKKTDEKDPPSKSNIIQALSKYNPDSVVSRNRWLRKAGKEETMAVEKLIKKLSMNHRAAPTCCPHFHVTSFDSLGVKPLKPKVYDYQINPEWVTQPWHTQYRQGRD
ncbi:uncharacterized protein LOC121321211 [Polyodon spathula]|uniref:uncharacterized protein LOC121321211 n=1 Tax=Polyodon spathula TaxID=7913 RepID=UPI001B7F3825|nr:uncharacterized protein LOC121321211 [Polyodon spathula]